MQVLLKLGLVPSNSESAIPHRIFVFVCIRILALHRIQMRVFILKQKALGNHLWSTQKYAFLAQTMNNLLD
ncbi:hypothetical protein AMS64_17745 [Aeromonas veronii]|nr:hypothetical protein AMS64_17745 [Aeromonas veronii]POG20807.1 hypothetical protein C2849_00360 [Aeromonas veronii]